MEKQIVANPYNGVLSSYKKDSSPVRVIAWLNLKGIIQNKRSQESIFLYSIYMNF